MKAAVLAELISKKTKDELFRLFSIAREEVQQLHYDEFSVGMTMLLMEWRRSTDSQSNPQEIQSSKVKIEEPVIESFRMKSDAQPAAIKYASRRQNPSQPKPPQSHEFESPIRVLQHPGNRMDSPKRKVMQSPRVVVIKQSEFKAYINKEAPKKQPIFSGDGPYLLPTRLDKKGKSSSKDSKGRR